MTGPPFDAGGGEATATQPSGIHEEILRRHAGKPGAESRALVGVLGAVLDAVAARGLSPSSTALFAAVMVALDGPGAMDDAQAFTAMTHLLDLVLVRVPPPVLRSRFGETARVLGAAVDAARAGENPAALRHIASCLSTLLTAAATDPAAASSPTAWAPLAGPFATLLGLGLAPNPKARRAAAAGAVAVLAALRAGGCTPLAVSASEAVVRTAGGVLPGPAAAAAAAARARGGAARAAADEAVGRAAADALHLLGLLRGGLPLLVPAGAAVRDVALQLILPLFSLRNPLLARHAADALRALLSGGAVHSGGGGVGGGSGPLAPARKGAAGLSLTPDDILSLVSGLIAAPGAWEGRDADALAAAAAALDAGLAALAVADPPSAAAALPAAAAALAPLLASDSDGVRAAAATALRAALGTAGGVTAAAAAVGRGRATTHPPPAAALAATLISALGPGARPGWAAALPAVADLFVAAAASGPPSQDALAALAPLVARVGALCAGAADVAEVDPSALPPDFAGPAAAALQAALTALGPEAVLGILPLGLGPALDGVRGAPDPRTWMLPALRSGVRGARLGYWCAHLLPLGRDMGSRSAVAAAAGDRLRALQTRALELQIWQALPAFANWAVDGGDALKAHARDIARAFTARPDLRPAICAALVRLCDQCAEEVEGGKGGAAGVSDNDSDFDLSGDEGGGPATTTATQSSSGPRPPQYTPAVAEATRAALAAQAKNWLPLLLNTLVGADPPERGPLAAAIGAYARSAAPPALVREHFGAALGQLAAATRDAAATDQGAVLPTTAAQGGTTSAARRVTFMDAALALAPGLPVEDVRALAAAAAPGLTDRAPAVQKRAYKLLAAVCVGRPDFLEGDGSDGLGGLLSTLLAAGPKTLPAAKRHRLAVVREAVLALRARGATHDDGGGAAAQASDAATLVAEVVLCVKEANRKTRAAAYALLVDLASPDADPPGSTPGTALRDTFAVVLGGLAGGSPHMVSAATMAAARLVHAFVPGPLGGDAGRLLSAILPLLRTPAREVIKAVLGFAKVCVGRLPAPELEAAAPDLLDGLLRWSDDPKNKFRLKVRIIVERLARRIGFDAVAAAMPVEDAKLLAHIRKQGARKARKKAAAAGGDDEPWSDGEDEDGGGGDDRRTTRTGKTGARSEWAPTALFSARTGRTGFTKAGKAPRTLAGGPGGGSALPGDRASADPVDLLGGGAARALAAGARGAGLRAGGRGRGRASDGEDSDFEVGDDGRLVVRDEDGWGKGGGRGKRGRAAFEDDDDADDDSGSDFGDIRRGGGGPGRPGAPRSTAAKSVGGRSAKSAGGRSVGGMSVGGRSAGGRSAGGRSTGTQAGQPSSRAHTGARFRAAKGGASGDVRRPGTKVEPYAYWPMDRSMLNRRPSKQVAAAKGLHGIVAAKAAAEGRGKHAAKRMRKL